MLYIRLGASLVIIFLLVKFGIPGLVSLSLWMGGLHKDTTTTTKQQQQQFIAPPLLTQTFTATNSATISISGTGTANATVKLYNNGNYLDSMTIGSDGNFTFDQVTLTDGQNSLQAKVTQNNAESDFSDPLTIAYLHAQPKLDISSPHDGDQFDKNTTSTTITGATDPNVTVTINGYRAIVDTTGNFSYSYQLKSGDNPLKIIATDAAGNTTEKDLTIKSNQ